MKRFFLISVQFKTLLFWRKRIQPFDLQKILQETFSTKDLFVLVLFESSSKKIARALFQRSLLENLLDELSTSCSLLKSVTKFSFLSK